MKVFSINGKKIHGISGKMLMVLILMGTKPEHDWTTEDLTGGFSVMFDGMTYCTREVCNHSKRLVEYGLIKTSRELRGGSLIKLYTLTVTGNRLALQVWNYALRKG